MADVRRDLQTDYSYDDFGRQGKTAQAGGGYTKVVFDDLTNGSRTQYATYGYLGAGVIVSVAHPAVSGGLVLDYGDDGSDGWDRFGRVTSQTWTNSAETTTFDDFAYTYDRASNRVTRDLSLTTGLNEKYTYDGLNRLANTERGTLSSGQLTNLAFEQNWSLDELGNWSEFKQDDDGGGTWDLDQDRTHNDANEITGGSWLTPAHDAAGNMTLAPRPADEADANDGLLLVYDAWNRLVEVHDDNDGDGVADAGELLASYEYDGQRRRIVETIENGESDIVRDSYYNDAWQVVEVREDGNADPLKQFIWDQRYVDSPVVRFRDGNTDGDYGDAEDDTLYYTTDANFNVTAVIDDSGNVVERYAYDPYGQVTLLDGTTGGQTDWAVDADEASDVDNRTLYAGYHLDAETGLYQVRNRMYHPTLGRWVHRDLIGYADGMNIYSYCQGRATGSVDPWGLTPEYEELLELAAAKEVEAERMFSEAMKHADQGRRLAGSMREAYDQHDYEKGHELAEASQSQYELAFALYGQARESRSQAKVWREQHRRITEMIEEEKTDPTPPADRVTTPRKPEPAPATAQATPDAGVDGKTNKTPCVPRGSFTAKNVQDLARVLMSEASIGNDVERNAVGWTVLNRMSNRNTNSVRSVWRAYARNQDPTEAMKKKAEALLTCKIEDLTDGATHFYSPRSMPKEGEPTRGYDVAGGLEKTPGVAKRNWSPGWSKTMTYVEIDGARKAYYKFYK